jgi:hypothetical protein
MEILLIVSARPQFIKYAPLYALGANCGGSIFELNFYNY